MAASIAVGGVIGAGALTGIQPASASTPPTPSSIFILSSAQTIAPSNNYAGAGGDTSGSVLVQAQDNANEEPVYQTSPLVVTITQLSASAGVVPNLPASVTIPTGAFAATFTFMASNSSTSPGNFTFEVSATGYDATTDTPPGETVEGLASSATTTVTPGDNNGSTTGPVSAPIGGTTTYFSAAGSGVTNGSGAQQSYSVIRVGGSITSGGSSETGLGGCTTVAAGGTASLPTLTLTDSTFRGPGTYTLEFLVEAFSGATCTTSVGYYQGDSQLVIANSAYTSFTPTRLLDTRRGSGPLGPGATRTISVVGGLGSPAVTVPANATAVTLNVTATDTTAGSFLTVFPAGGAVPTPSNLNWYPGDTVANLVTVQIGTGGEVSFYNKLGSTDLVVDLEGYFAPEPVGTTAGSFVPLSPDRICDTRSASITGYTTECSGDTLAPGGTLTFQVTGVGGSGIPAVADVSAVAVNVTATDTTTAGFLTVYPEGATLPTASNVNWSAGNTVPNRVIVKVGSTGEVSIYNNVGHADIVVDVNGYFTTGATAPSNETLFTPVAPVRVCDTRPASETGYTTECTGHTLTSGGTLAAQIAGIADLYPFGGSATAVALNATVTNPTTSSFLTIYPGSTPPTTSDVNWSAGETVPNFTITSLSSSGAINLQNEQGSADVVLDVSGYFSPD